MKSNHPDLVLKNVRVQVYFKRHFTNKKMPAVLQAFLLFYVLKMVKILWLSGLLLCSNSSDKPARLR